MQSRNPSLSPLRDGAESCINSLCSLDENSQNKPWHRAIGKCSLRSLPASPPALVPSISCYGVGPALPGLEPDQVLPATARHHGDVELQTQVGMLRGRGMDLGACLLGLPWGRPVNRGCAGQSWGKTVAARPWLQSHIQWVGRSVFGLLTVTSQNRTLFNIFTQTQIMEVINKGWLPLGMVITSLQLHSWQWVGFGLT